MELEYVYLYIKMDINVNGGISLDKNCLELSINIHKNGGNP